MTQNLQAFLGLARGARPSRPLDPEQDLRGFRKPPALTMPDLEPIPEQRTAQQTRQQQQQRRLENVRCGFLPAMLLWPIIAMEGLLIQCVQCRLLDTSWSHGWLAGNAGCLS